MRRVIIKSKLNNQFDLIQRLGEIGFGFGETYYQHDRVFVPRDYEKGGNFPRLVLRTEIRDKRRQPVYKLSLRRHIEDSGIDFVEMTQVMDYVATANLIAQLGFTLKAEVSRQRRALALSKMLRMYLDEVEGVVGEYIKLESDLLESDKVSVVREDLIDTLGTLGQPREDLVLVPYADLLQK